MLTDHPDGAFKDRDLYVFVYNVDRNCLAQGASPKMVGKNLLIMNDADGNPFIKGMIDMVKSKGSGWYGPAGRCNQVRLRYAERARFLPRRSAPMRRATPRNSRSNALWNHSLRRSVTKLNR